MVVRKKRLVGRRKLAEGGKMNVAHKVMERWHEARSSNNNNMYNNINDNIVGGGSSSSSSDVYAEIMVNNAKQEEIIISIMYIFLAFAVILQSIFKYLIPHIIYTQ